MYQALYRSFRPETFSQMLGQEHIVRILKNQLVTNTVSHAYLFCGTRGTGKTTTARLLAKGLNCRAADPAGRPCGECEACKAIAAGTYLDVMEIDAASNSGVDNIRELRESVKYPPTSGPFKVYIIDEVHMLTTEAFNALLKTLEEPPAGVIFILATTEPQKIPATILSRCLKLDFRRVPEQKMREGLRAICGSMGVKISEAALGLIASNADGSVRDALSLLDQCLSAGDKSVSRKEVLDLLGTSGEEVFLEMTELVTAGRTGEALLLLARVLDDGKDVRQFLKDWMEHYRNLLIAKYVEKPEEILNLSGENTNRLKAQAAKMDLSQIREGIVELSGASAEAKWSTRPRVLLELAAVRLSSGEEMEPVSAPRRERPVRRQPAAAPVQQEPQDLPYGDMPAYAEAAPWDAPSAPWEEPSGMPASAEAPAPEKKPAKAAPAGNLDDFWQGILAEGEKSRSSLHMLRVGSRMVAMNEKVFSIQAKNDTAYRYGEMYRRELEELMQKQTGVSRKLEMLPPGQAPAQGGAAGGAEGQAPAGRREKSAEDLARELENQLGIHVEIQ